MQILAYLLARFSEPSSYAGPGAFWLCRPEPVRHDRGAARQLLAGGCALLAGL